MTEPQLEPAPRALQPFGANLFMGNFLRSREDGLNPDYVIMPGDHVNMNVWGALNVSNVFVVDGQGNIFLPEIGPIRRIRPIFLLLTPLLQPRRSQLLSVTTAGHKATLKCRDLLVEQVVRLVDQTQHCVRNDGGVTSVEPAQVLFPVIRRISPI